MGKNEKIEQSGQQKKKRQKRIITGTVCIAITAVVIIACQPKQKEQPPEGGAMPTSTIRLVLDDNGDLRVPVDILGDRLKYVNYGGKEALIILKDSDGGIRTALDTCEECYASGNVHFTSNGIILTCRQCGTEQPQSDLGTEFWGGCRPISITSKMRDDTDTEVVIPAGVLNYAEDMFKHWDQGDFSVSFNVYGTDEANVNE